MAIFFDIDNFCKEIDEFSMKKDLLGDGVARRNRKSQLSLSEKMTIYVCFHLSGYTNFKRYYNELVKERWKDLFPQLVSYERFNQSQNRLFIPLMMYLTKPALRKQQNKVFKGFAQKSKSTMGWFVGFKLHLITNDKRELLNFCFSRAKVADRDLNIVKLMTKEVFGKRFGDRGHISEKLAEFLWNDDIFMIYQRRKNRKKMDLSDTDKVFLRKRAVIESVNDELKNICSQQHTRHRSMQGFLNHAVTSLIAYQTFTKKPSIKMEHYLKDNQPLLPFLKHNSRQ